MCHKKSPLACHRHPYPSHDLISLPDICWLILSQCVMKVLSGMGWLFRGFVGEPWTSPVLTR